MAAQQVQLASGYVAEMRDVLRRLNIQDPLKRRWFLWGVRSRFEVGLRLIKPRLSDELMNVHLDAVEAAGKAIQREDLRRQVGNSVRALVRRLVRRPLRQSHHQHRRGKLLRLHRSRV